jgi:hypothetical protein
MAMPYEIEIVPHRGIGPLRLGMTVAEADAAVGAFGDAGVRRSRGARHWYFDAALEFELGGSGRVQFIGVANHPKLACRYHGHDVFDTPAPELFALIAAERRERTGTAARNTCSRTRSSRCTRRTSSTIERGTGRGRSGARWAWATRST